MTTSINPPKALAEPRAGWKPGSLVPTRVIVGAHGHEQVTKQELDRQQRSRQKTSDEQRLRSRLWGRWSRSPFGLDGSIQDAERSRDHDNTAPKRSGIACMNIPEDDRSHRHPVADARYASPARTSRKAKRAASARPPCQGPIREIAKMIIRRDTPPRFRHPPARIEEWNRH